MSFWPSVGQPNWKQVAFAIGGHAEIRDVKSPTQGVKGSRTKESVRSVSYSSSGRQSADSSDLFPSRDVRRSVDKHYGFIGSNRIEYFSHIQDAATHRATEAFCTLTHSTQVTFGLQST
ncbi:uncharacterized protein SPSK_03741 [Sporothrix schenckii 1099-18]|uniref:Uncharacterized protein n=1 Tax=Sporothrix schenckii 1099-18 TaxID=1397361 RepID=A0A0F2LZL7_SPOSC|nr:uncharacterized protein SPSK_03741 [Sporothrix schenckii 1099-18]KJR82279.1 hypothetical protein SPSK_03741 [Sporothrix schenckii 1099-18]